MMPPAFDVLSYGTIGADLVLEVPHWPTPDSGTHARSRGLHPGGKATNTGSLLARWGLRVAVSGTVIGDDEMGNRLVTMLEQVPGLSLDYLERRPGLDSMYCCVLVRLDGERAIIGVNADEVPYTLPSRAMIENTHVLTLDLYGGAERVEIARLAHAQEKPVVVGDVRSPEHPVLLYATIALASAAELRQSYPGRPAAEFAAAVLSRGPACVMVTAAAGPVQVFSRSGGVSILPPAVQVVDTTGAGDAFRAGVVYGIRHGWPLEECAAFGTAAGSLKTRVLGAASGPWDVEDVRSLAASLTRTKFNWP